MVAVKIVGDDFVAKDLVQDFFIKYWEARDRIKPKNFDAYAYRCIKNSCFNYMKRQAATAKHFVALPLSDLEDFPEDGNVEEELPERERRLKMVLLLLNELPAERRKVFELHAVEELSYTEIAEKLGISKNTVKTQLRRAYSTLRGKTIALIMLSYLMKYF